MLVLTLARWILQVVIGVVIVVELVLGLGVLLQAMSANPDASFSEWAYRNQDRVMTPFEDMFEDASIGDSEGEGVLDVSGVFAMAAYGTLFIPLGIAFGRVRRAESLRLQRREEEKMERVREARYQGREPADLEDEAPTGWLARLRSRFTRTRPAGDSAPEDGDTKTEWQA